MTLHLFPSKMQDNLELLFPGYSRMPDLSQTSGLMTQLHQAAYDNQAAKWGRGLNNSQARCHVVRLRGPPAFIGHATRRLDSPVVAQEMIESATPRNVTQAAVARSSLTGRRSPGSGSRSQPPW